MTSVPAKKPHTVKILQFNGSSTSHVEITQTFESKEAADAAMAKRDADRAAERKKAMDTFQAQNERALSNNAGSDVVPVLLAAVRDKWKNPGKKEVLASVRSLTPEWTTADLSKINTYVATGKPPSTVDIKELAKKWKAETAGSQSRIESMMFGMLGDLGINNPDLAVYWLAKALPTVFMHQNVMSNVIRGAQPGFGTTREGAWLKAVSYYNGACKNLWEAKTFGNPKDATEQSGAQAESESEEEEEEEEEEAEADKEPEKTEEQKGEKRKADDSPAKPSDPESSEPDKKRAKKA